MGGGDWGSNQAYKFRSVHGAGQALCSGKKVNSIGQIALIHLSTQRRHLPARRYSGKWQVGGTYLTVSIAKVPAMFYLSRLPWCHAFPGLHRPVPSSFLKAPIWPVEAGPAQVAQGAAGLTHKARELQGCCCFENPRQHSKRWAETLHFSLRAFRPLAPDGSEGRIWMKNINWMV